MSPTEDTESTEGNRGNGVASNYLTFGLVHIPSPASTPVNASGP